MSSRERPRVQLSGRPAPPEPGAAIGGRFEFQRELGGGGMAVVYEVVDRQRGERVALKRLHVHARPERERRARALFEHEYYTLSQLRHPRIVQVYDYGLDELGPFYTMELLDGGDLHKLAPVGASRLCQIAVDVCSALSLLHSRRLLHRDVSLRNVRCSQSGTAKLIDFGVMSHFGSCKELVGTPPYIAPELVNLQPLDARTDLFALGATLYFALTGRHAYPARDFAHLPQVWRGHVARPSELVPDVPEALDVLVLDLLQLDPSARPRSAAEVLDRLAALDGRLSPEGAAVEAQAYLSIPTFVGRQQELSRMRSKLERARGGRGSATLIEAGAGIGRSRFLDAVVLRGKLLGFAVLRSFADESELGDYDAVRGLLSQLQWLLPDELAIAIRDQLEVLGHIAPELLPEAGSHLRDFSDRTALRPRVQQSLRHVFTAVSAKQPLLIAVDDLPLLDEPSVAALALLAREVGDNAIQIAATAPASYSSREDSAYRVYADLANRVGLAPLSDDEAHSLLVSLFGDCPGLDALGQQLMPRAHGSPRDLLRLAQHLVDRGVVRYEAGAWSLPVQLDPGDLPTSMAQVLRATVNALDEQARMLAATFSLRPDHSFTFDECRVLLGRDDPAQLASVLGCLVSAQVLRASAERYALTDQAYVPVLLSLLGKTETEAAHSRLAAAFCQRGDDVFREAQHLLRAGRCEQALDSFVAHAIESQRSTDDDPDAFYKLLRSLPDDWLTTYEEVLSLGQRLGRPQSQLYVLRGRLAGLVGVIGPRAAAHVSELIVDLARVAGLDDYAQLDPSLPASERLELALAAADARYQATPEHERICEPRAAVRAIGRATLTANGMFAPLLDPAGLRALPSLSPLSPLSPALDVVAQLSEGVQARVTGRIDHALEIYRAILQRTATPDRGGLSLSHQRLTRMTVMSAIAMIEASMGLASSLQWAEELERDPLFQVNALQARALHRLWQGDRLEAERQQREVEARRVESGARQNQENNHLLWQVTAHAGMEDLTRLRRSVEEIRRVGGEFVGWRPVISYAIAEYQRARGDVRRAIVELQDTLESVHAGEHQIWSPLAAAHVRALCDARKYAQAVELGRRYCADAEQAGIGFAAHCIALSLAIAEAKLNLPEAAPRAEKVIERLKALGTTGLRLALAYEARIRVAIAQVDREAYARFVADYSRDCLSPGGEALSSKLNKLVREAQACRLVEPPEGESSLESHTVKSKLLRCGGAAERAHVMLAVLAASCGASEGFLYLNSEEGPAWAASVGSRAAPPEALDRLAREYIASQAAVDLDVTADVGPEEISGEWSALGDASYQPLLLSHYSDSGVHVVTGLLVLLVNGRQTIVRSDFATQMSRVAMELGDSVPISVLGADESDERV